jgi:hypothetical protein
MQISNSLPAHLATAVREETQGQAVIWVGQSSPLKTLGMGMAIWFFAIPWTVFALGWEAMALSMFFGNGFMGDNGNAGQGGVPFLFSIIFPLWGLPFIAIGFGMLASPFWAARTAKNTATILTDTRLMTLTAYSNGKRQVSSNPVSSFVSIVRTERADGSGDLAIMAGRERDSDGDLRDRHHKLVGIPNVRQVESRIRNVMAKPAR